MITRVVKFHPGTRENVASMSIFYINGGQTSAPMRLFCVYIVARETIYQMKFFVSKICLEVHLKEKYLSTGNKIRSLQTTMYFDTSFFSQRETEIAQHKKVLVL